MQKKRVILQGGGEHARVVLDALLATDTEVLALFDPKYSGELFGIPQLGKYDPGFEPEAKAIVAIGDNALRKQVAGHTNHKFTMVIHPTVIVSRFCQIGEGSMLLHGAIVQARSKVGMHVIINTGARIDHDCELADYVHIAPGCTLCGTVKVGEGTLVGAGSVILPGIKIGNWSVIGAGSVVTRNVPDGVVVAGNPARQFRQVK
jgi:sugar O-acyltransferase (sialic acid O-acetyltransferase NeuD family)